LVFCFISTGLKETWFLGAFTWFGGTSLLVNFVGSGTADFAIGAGVAGLAEITVCLRAAGVTFFAAELAACWFWLILWTTEECGTSVGALFTKLYFAVV
jgi:hypothetical protein